MRRAWLLAVLTGCATVAPQPPVEEKPAPPEPTAAERACIEALKATGERLSTDEFTSCERDSDCRGVSALLSGHCGAVINAKVFDAHLEEFQAQTATCAAVVQVVPRCVRLQPVCRAQRCTAEPISELPDECAELGAALAADAAAANTCATDADCTTLEGERPATVAFVEATVERREQLARACGTVPPALFIVRPQPTEAFCVERRCQSEKASPRFTTVVRERKLTAPELDGECIRREFLDSFDSRSVLARTKRWELSFIANIDVEGRLNQFEFLLPANLPPAAQAAFASRLHGCTAKPARYRGKAIAIRYRSTILLVRK